MLKPAFALSVLALPLSAQDPSEPPARSIEFGEVAWLRDLDAGLASSKQHHKPVFLLFQEVPG